MKKRVSALIFTMVFVLGVATCGGCTQNNAQPTQGSSQNGQSDGKVYELSLSTHDPASSAKTKYHIEWANRINEASGGRLKITVYSDGVLAPGTGALDALRTGVCDIAWIMTNYWPGQFPITEAITLPLGMTTVPQATNILWDLYETEPAYQAEISEFIPLQIHTCPPCVIGMATKPIKNVNDLAGMKIRSPGGIPTDSFIAWGATPMQIAPGDIFQAVERGTIDGYCIDFSGIVSFSLQTVSKYYLDYAVYNPPYYLFMNKSSFEELPSDLQDLIMSFSTRKESLEMAYVYENDVRRGLEAINEAGGTIISPSDADAEKMRTIAGNIVINDWIKNNTTADFDAQAYVDKVASLAEKYYITRDELNAELDRQGF
jgi:TRAP-type C4-dicarboxylate transport system substrate-binding protein